jgi:ATP-dependent exoDNAse (exonuclease V) beta subunit
MTQNLNNFLQQHNSEKHATDSGTETHKLLQSVFFDDNDHYFGDPNIVNSLKQHREISKYFNSSSMTEVPIAGYIKNEFVSRRIDRLLINHDTKNIVFIDYKTDTDKLKFIDKYKKQLSEYSILLKDAYPNYSISGFILWTNDWSLEKII